VPDRPRSWLLTVAGRCLVDGWRAESARRRRETVAALDPTDHTPAADLHDTDLHDADREDTLVLLFLCCHQALSPPSQLALTLRAVAEVHRGDRGRVPGCRGHDRQAHRPGQAAHPQRRGPIRAAGRAGAH
jgi:predicted RNA polymerase sigma factor